MPTKSTKYGNRGSTSFQPGDVSGKKINYSYSCLEGNSPGQLGMEATGGTVGYCTETNGQLYKVHKFESSGSFVIDTASTNPTLPNEIEYLVVGGGGGGGNTLAGAGGAGGFRTNNPFTPNSAPDATATPDATYVGAPYPVAEGDTYAVTVGGGGGDSSVGSASKFYAPGASFPDARAIYAAGGGEGGDGPTSGGNGGSGGGGGGYGTNSSPPNRQAAGTSDTDGALPVRQGYPGGLGGWYPPGYGGGGGGGAARQGYDGSNTAAPTTTGTWPTSTGGKGGDGILSPLIPSPPTVNSGRGYYFAGGGGGGAYKPSMVGGNGGGGGGGGGGVSDGDAGEGDTSGNALNNGSDGAVPNGAGGSGGQYTGGGGGGGAHPSRPGGSGGTGYVAVRYKIIPSQVT